MHARGSLSLVALGLLLIAGSAVAQGLYRHVDANGRVTYSDQPPAAGATAPVRGAAGTGSAAGLPYALRQVAQRYPATLYTSDDCAPCAEGRTLLQTRGIPFEERTVKTTEDIQAFERLSGQNSLPLLTLGGQQLKGFSENVWTQYLDAAGYPRTSQLPIGYRQPSAQPLVAAAPVTPNAAPAPAPAVAETPAPASSANAPGASNPAGIRF